LLDEEISRRLPDITPDLVEITIHRLRFIGDYVRSPRKHFQYERDPQDAKFIELAIALDATHIVSADKDLLSLPISRTDGIHAEVRFIAQSRLSYFTAIRGRKSPTNH